MNDLPLNDLPLDTYLVLTMFSGVVVGNLVMLLLVAGWRTYTEHEWKGQDPPMWSHLAILIGALGAILGVLIFIFVVFDVPWPRSR